MSHGHRTTTAADAVVGVHGLSLAVRPLIPQQGAGLRGPGRAAGYR